MKRIFGIVLATALVAGIAGCGSTSEQRLAMYRDAMAQAQTMSAQLDAYLPQINEAIASAEAAIQAGLPEEQAAKLLDKINEAKAVKEQILTYKASATEAAARAQTAINTILEGGQTDFAAEMQAIGAMLASAGEVIPPPTGPFVALGGTILGILGGIFGGVRSQKKYKTGLVDVVKSVDKVLDNLSEDEGAKALSVMANTQADTTRTLVRTIKMPKAA